jgi:molecular chaperone DnaK
MDSGRDTIDSIRDGAGEGSRGHTMRTVGIDLGTTNTVVALDGTVIRHFVGEVAQSILPSVVAFTPAGDTLVGAPARARRAIDAKNTIFSAKRLMGQGFRSYATTKFRNQYPFDVVDQHGLSAFRTRAGVFTPVDIAARVIGHAIHELFVDGARVRTVVTVPSAFDDKARDATLEAAARAGLLDVLVVPEPVAAVHAYRRREKGRKALELGRTVVFDMGGGTFDVAVVDCRGGDDQVLAHGGDPYLGGDDLDATLADWVAQAVLERFGWDLRSDAEVMDRLMVQCEYAKVRLGLDTEASIELGQVDAAAPVASQRVAIDRAMFEALSRELVARTFIVCDEVLGKAGLTVRDVDTVLLSGGTTILPMVRDGVARYFGKTPRADVNPMEVVSIGASLVPD